jgi:hypothetical protein
VYFDTSADATLQSWSEPSAEIASGSFTLQATTAQLSTLRIVPKLRIAGATYNATGQVGGRESGALKAT